MEKQRLKFRVHVVAEPAFKKVEVPMPSEMKPLIVFNRYLDRSNIGNIRNVAELASCVESGYERMTNPMRIQIVVQEAEWLHDKEFRRRKEAEFQHNDDCPAKDGKPVCICPQHRRYA